MPGNFTSWNYQHFLGNQTPFVTTDPVGSYRLLDYYRYSTQDNILAGTSIIISGKFLVTSFPWVRLTASQKIYLSITSQHPHLKTTLKLDMELTGFYVFFGSKWPPDSRTQNNLKYRVPDRYFLRSLSVKFND